MAETEYRFIKMFAIDELEELLGCAKNSQIKNKIALELAERTDAIMAIMAMMAILEIPLQAEMDQAILVFPGPPEQKRVQFAAQIWLDNRAFSPVLFAAGTNRDYQFEFGPYTKKSIAALCGVSERHKDIIVREEAKHTLDQTNWICGMLKKKCFNHIRNIILTVSPYYMLRAYLTMVAGLMRNNLAQRVKLMPAMVRPADTRRIQLIPGEIVRIYTYREKGDVASLAILHKYLSFHWDIGQ